MKIPNILIFMTDHQRGDTVLPEQPAFTPNLAGFAREGITFSETYCPSPHCCPSRATFFSGLYPSRSGVWNNICNKQALSTGLKEGVKLWSEDLADAGYDLHFCGKWHVSVEESPKDRGWHEHFVTAAAGTYHGQTWEHYHKIAQQPDQTARGESQILRPGYGTYRLYGTGSDKGNSHDERTVAEALDVLPELTEGSDPWCLYVGAIAPHDPYMVPGRFLDMYDIENIPLPPAMQTHYQTNPGFINV